MQLTFDFLKLLRDNNNRPWFQENKEQYEKSLEQIKSFREKVLALMQGHDHIEDRGKKIYRIYRDTRFSKDKTPYKTYWAGNFKRSGQSRRGGYYFQIEPGNSHIAGGFFNPNSDDLFHIRKQISADPETLQSILDEENFKNYFGRLMGNQVKTAPKGFSKEDPAITLIRYKQFYVEHYFSDQEVLADDFPQKMSEGFQNMRPYFDYMTDILTTDLNGESLLEE